MDKELYDEKEKKIEYFWRTCDNLDCVCLLEEKGATPMSFF